MAEHQKAFNDLSPESRARLLHQMDKLCFKPQPFFKGRFFGGTLLTGLIGVLVINASGAADLASLVSFDPPSRILPGSYWFAYFASFALIIAPIGERVWQYILGIGLPWKRGIHLLPLHIVDARSAELLISDLELTSLQRIRAEDGWLFGSWEIQGKSVPGRCLDDSESRSRIAKLESFVATARNARNLREIGWLKAVSPFSMLPSSNSADVPLAQPQTHVGAKVLAGCGLFVILIGGAFAKDKQSEFDRTIFERLEKMAAPSNNAGLARQQAQWEWYIQAGGGEQAAASAALIQLPKSLENKKVELKRIRQERQARQLEAQERRAQEKADRAAKQQAEEKQRQKKCRKWEEMKRLRAEIPGLFSSLEKENAALDREYKVLNQRRANQREADAFNERQRQFQGKVKTFDVKVRRHDSLADQWEALNRSEQRACQ